MKNVLDSLIAKKNRQDFKALIHFFVESKTSLLLRNDIIQVFREYCDRQKKSKLFRIKSSHLSL